MFYPLSQASRSLLDVRNFGATPGGSDCTAAFSAAMAANGAIYIPAGTWFIDTLSVALSGARIFTDGLSSIIAQRPGNIGTRLIHVLSSNVSIDSLSLVGNIATDTGEQNHGLFISPTVSSIQHISVGDIRGSNIRGDVLHIAATAALQTSYVTFGKIVGSNVFRNVVAITGGSFIEGVACITDGSTGYTTLDIEPNTATVTDVRIGFIRGAQIQISSPSSSLLCRRFTISTVVLNPALASDSSPAYPSRNISNAVQLRNCHDIRIDHLDIANHVGVGVFYAFSGGDVRGEGISIGYLRSAGVGSVDVTYNCICQFSDVNTFTIHDGDVLLQAVGDTVILGNSGFLTRGVISRLRADGRVGNFLKNTTFLNIIINTATGTSAFRNLQDCTVLNSSIVVPTGFNFCDRVTFINSNFTCSTAVIGASCTGIQIYGDTMSPALIGSAVYDPPNLADGAGVTTTVTVTGAAVGDFVEAAFSLDLQGITLTSWISAANTASVRFQNETGGAIDLASGTILIRSKQK